MKEPEIREVAAELAFIMPYLGKKLIKPMEHHAKCLLSPLMMEAIFLLTMKEEYTMTELAKVMKNQQFPINAHH